MENAQAKNLTGRALSTFKDYNPVNLPIDKSVKDPQGDVSRIDCKSPSMQAVPEASTSSESSGMSGMSGNPSSHSVESHLQGSNNTRLASVGETQETSLSSIFDSPSALPPKIECEDEKVYASWATQLHTSIDIKSEPTLQTDESELRLGKGGGEHDLENDIRDFSPITARVKEENMSTSLPDQCNESWIDLSHTNIEIKSEHPAQTNESESELGKAERKLDLDVNYRDSVSIIERVKIENIGTPHPDECDESLADQLHTKIEIESEPPLQMGKSEVRSCNEDGDLDSEVDFRAFVPKITSVKRESVGTTFLGQAEESVGNRTRTLANGEKRNARHIHVNMSPVSMRDSKKMNAKPSICNICGASFTTKTSMTRYIQINTGEKPFNCSHCSSSFSSKDNLKKHMRTRTAEKPFKCRHCTACFAHKRSLKEHVRTHTGEIFSCSHCSSSFSRKENLKVHMRTHTGEKPFSCSHCTARFAYKKSLTAHVRTHTGEKPFSCNHCTAIFAQKYSLMKHIRTHTGEKPFSCSHCTACFADKYSLSKHVRTHTGEISFSCSHCSSSFSRKEILKVHMRTHTGEKPFSCSHCSACFAHKHSLTEHVRTHTGEISFSCSHCSSSFSRKENLKVHMRTHTGEKPFSCSYCSASFAVKSNLTTHIRTHTGEKPFNSIIAPPLSVVKTI